MLHVTRTPAIHDRHAFPNLPTHPIHSPTPVFGAQVVLNTVCRQVTRAPVPASCMDTLPLTGTH